MSAEYDESKHERDEKGRFSTQAAGTLGRSIEDSKRGLGTWVNKMARSSGNKLDGYNIPQGPPKGRLEHDPSKETSPLSKWVASKHSIELDLLKASKSDRNPSTGDLTNSVQDVRTSQAFAEKALTDANKQKDAAIKEARKAIVSTVGYKNKVGTAQWNLEQGQSESKHYASFAVLHDKIANKEPLTPEEQTRADRAHGMFAYNGKDYFVHPPDKDENHPSVPFEPKDYANRLRTRSTSEAKRAADAQKELAKQQPKLEAAQAREKEAIDKVATTYTRVAAAVTAKDITHKLNAEMDLSWKHKPGATDDDKDGGIQKDDKRDYTMSVTRHPTGSIEFNVHGTSRDPNYPGEKHLTIMVHPGDKPPITTIDKKKNVKMDWNRPAGFEHKRVSVILQMPDHKDGSTHPLNVETDEGHAVPTNRTSSAWNTHISNFFHEVDTLK